MAFDWDFDGDVDAMRGYAKAIAASTSQISAALQQLALSFGAPGAAAAATTGGAFVPTWPVNFTTFLESLVAGGDPGTVAPFFSRGHLLVTPHSTTTLETDLTAASVGFTVYRLRIWASAYTPDVLTTYQQDTQDALINAAPLGDQFEILGAFLPPARSVLTLTMDSSVNFSLDAYQDFQAAVLPATYYTDVVQPILRANKAFADALAAGILVSQR